MLSLSGNIAGISGANYSLFKKSDFGDKKGEGDNTFLLKRMTLQIIASADDYSDK